MSDSPSPSYGLSHVGKMWRVVVAVWLVTVAVFIPARVVVWTAVVESFATLPGSDLPDGELALITVELLRPVLAPLAAALISGWLALWVWTVLWHAGVVRWFVLSGRSGVRLTEILGRGLLDGWRWVRLGLTSLVVLVLTHAGLGMALNTAKDHARASNNDEWLGSVLAAAVVVSAVVVVFAWLATLRGSWLLGVGDRRSAVLAWFAGLWGTVRRPVRSLATLVVWAVPGIAAIAGPILLGWNFEVLRSPVPSMVIDAAAGLLAALCWVGLFLSFAPVTGLVDNDGP